MVACPVSYLACAAYPVSYFLDTGRTPRGGLGQRRLKFPALRAVRGAPFTSCHGPRAGGPPRRQCREKPKKAHKSILLTRTRAGPWGAGCTYR